MITELQIGEERSNGPVDAILQRPDRAFALLVFAHGAGADLRHRFMQETAAALAGQGVATLRFNFPYMQSGRRRPDAQPVLEAYVRAACARAQALEPALPLFAGGKSMGGRMTSSAAAKQALPQVRGLVFFGFPLHPPKKPSIDRAAHLQAVTVPMLFLQGTRDDLADLELIRRVTSGLGERATLHIVDGADHSFDLLKRSGRSTADARHELVSVAVAWLRGRT